MEICRAVQDDEVAQQKELILRQLRAELGKDVKLTKEALARITFLPFILSELSDVGLALLPRLDGLTSLDLSFTKIRKLSPLGRFPNLDSLTMLRSTIEDISSLDTAPGLTKLVLSDRIADISIVANLKKLTFFMATLAPI